MDKLDAETNYGTHEKHGKGLLKQAARWTGSAVSTLLTKTNERKHTKAYFNVKK
ncbi:MAG: hypothetical protein IKW86_03225 [Salinivirgaceae bacterium]|nr:hypothetical protein [Salinivirgaceae bacterium]